MPLINYPDNETIDTFINRVQNKIADLSSLIVERGGYIPEALYLLLELSDFLECLTSDYNLWSLDTIYKYVQIYNERADLNSIPYLDILGFSTEILTGTGTGIGLPITTSDISDFISSTNTLITQTPHNTLANIQGGNSTERYHLTLAEITFLRNLINPFISPTVALTLSTVPNVVWHEKGTSVTLTTLQGSYSLNSGGSLTSYIYRRVGGTPEVIGSGTNSTIPQLVHTTPVISTTTFRFEATFNQGGTIMDSKQVRFTPPIFFGIANRGASTNTIKNLTKVIEDPSINPRTFSYSLPSDNTTRPSNTQVVPYLLVPKSKGTPSKFEIGVFDTYPDWIITSASVTLQDNTDEPYWRCEFKNTVVGSYDFKTTFI